MHGTFGSILLPMRRFALVIALVGGFSLCPLAGAAGITITPDLIDSSEPVMRALQQNAGHASTKLKGKGGALHLTYQSEEAIQVYMVGLAANGSFVPTDFMYFTLPASDHGDQTIDVTVSPSWSFRETTYQLNMLTKSDGANVSFYAADFVPASPLSAITTPFKQFMRAEPYTPSTYHALYGYRMLGTSVVMLLGITIVLVAGIILLLYGTKAARILLITMICIQLLYALRVSVDMMRFSTQHLGEYYGKGSYDEAGYMYAVAADITRFARESGRKQSVYMCRDGTNFKEKLLRYFIYPLPVSAEPAMASGATLAVVSDKFKQGYTFTDGQLACGLINIQATKLITYPDGTEIYQIPRSTSHL
jgi:hypothetical protein